ncbi:hypothetical protein ACFC1T_09200 [Kitasatospora sp. NPDC056076]|uniref:hypothetical protein n=1 Tax=Kitasatospora sp. NPDC056076 TaxID=3345703 RepID=UPI0035E1C01F
MIVDILRLTECPAKEPCAEDAINVYYLATPGRAPVPTDNLAVSCCPERAQVYVARFTAAAHLKEKAELPALPTAEQMAPIDRALAALHRHTGAGMALRPEERVLAAAYCALTLPKKTPLDQVLGTAERYEAWMRYRERTDYELLLIYGHRKAGQAQAAARAARTGEAR